MVALLSTEAGGGAGGGGMSNRGRFRIYFYDRINMMDATSEKT